MSRGAIALAAAGCGDNLDDPPALQPADTLVVAAHFDDDTIFMQPELHTAVASGSVTTVYVSSGDPVHGGARAAHTFMAARMGYSSVAGSRDWNCGYAWLAGSPAYRPHVFRRIARCGQAAVAAIAATAGSGETPGPPATARPPPARRPAP